MYIEYAILAGFALLYSLVAGRLESTSLTGPIVFLGFGFIAGPLGLDWLELDVGRDWLRILADLTLALVLFADAAKANRSVLRSSAAIPVRMLLFGVPMTIALGIGAGLLLFEQLSIWELALLATI